MDHWYYATADGQRRGPVSATDLKALLAAGGITRQTLVWREGLPHWCPLAAQAAALGLPPPLPAASAPPAGLPRAALIALAVVAGLVVLAVLGGVGAAFGIPAYRDYRLRAHAAAAVAEASGHQAAVAAFVGAQGRCPENGDPGFGAPEEHAGGHLARVRFGRFPGTGRCGLQAVIAAPGQAPLDGMRIWLEYDEAGAAWECSSQVDDRYLPPRCRG